MAGNPRIGGRRPQFDLDDIVRAGLALGLHRLSVQALADELGVSAAAVYRLVPGRVALERLIGEAVLAGCELPDDPADSVREHLVSFALRLRAFLLAHPGSARYLQLSFPRGPSGAKLQAAEVVALTSRGYDPSAAAGLCGSVASVAIGLVVGEEGILAHAEDIDAAAELAADTSEVVMADPLLKEAHVGVPVLGPGEFFAIVLTATVDGLVTALPPGRPLGDVITAARAAADGRES
ncbi:TetR/AcrR family transcriptional regulator [Phytomonospora endophytica]|uniref:AcrR family transcriptional regulator n=1 Tax=Phytomonospora endophytica TaxID=714109 RepID=A0A841FAP4_9ACTN|nr:TetR/AcrR family transcriptional regulator C-terminal domain-containing protein [Phytomonospora endophytica]MBB6034331.1 AcrR family transcriptional regulator [Phytomonospora endophytica]